MVCAVKKKTLIISNDRVCTLSEVCSLRQIVCCFFPRRACLVFAAKAKDLEAEATASRQKQKLKDKDGTRRGKYSETGWSCTLLII